MTPHKVETTRMYLSDYLHDNHIALYDLFRRLTIPLAERISARAFAEPVILQANWKTKHNPIYRPGTIEYTAELHWMKFKDWANENLVAPDAELITSIKLPLTNKNMFLNPKYLRLK